MVADESASEALIIEDDALLARFYAEQLRGAGIPAVTVGDSGSRLRADCGDAAGALVLPDLSLPDAKGARHSGRSALPGGNDVVVTAHSSVNVAIEAMRAGAHDFLVKPFPPERLVGW